MIATARQEGALAIAFSVGIGLTNECNLRCAHCYRPDMVVERLTRADVRRVCDAVPAASMNLGVGENGLHSEYQGILDDLAVRGIKTSITSNGLSLERLDDARLIRFHSVELSLDFPTEREHDAFRGQGNWRTVVTTEPVLAAVLGLRDFPGPGCGRSTVRIAPDGRVLPCTYWPGSHLTIGDLERAGGNIVEADEFVAARRIPPACVDCPCRGGCAGRRALTGRPDAPDPYCPFARGELVVLDWERAGR